MGGGSLTALPVIETQAGDVSAYIPTNAPWPGWLVEKSCWSFAATSRGGLVTGMILAVDFEVSSVQQKAAASWRFPTRQWLLRKG